MGSPFPSDCSFLGFYEFNSKLSTADRGTIISGYLLSCLQMVEWKIPELRDVFRAEKILRKHFAPSPLVNASREMVHGIETFLKLENFLPTGSFKVRGATYLISQLKDEEKEAGVIAASTGNFSQGVSYGADLYGLKARIVMPEGSNERKVRATKDLGGEVIFHGQKFDDSRKHAEELAASHGYRYIHSANEPMLVAGVGTHTLELLEQEPEIEAIIVPVGGGSGACGASVVTKAVSKDIMVIGVQSESSPAAYLSWKSGKHERADNLTYAEGLATGESFDFTQNIMRKLLDDFILVSDDEIRNAWKTLVRETRIIPESASAAALAAEIRMSAKLRGKKVALIVTGGNSPQDQIDSLLK